MSAQITSKELVQRLFLDQELPRLPFIPWLGGHTAKLEQISLRTMTTDPGKLSTALQNAWKLYGHDAITSPFDPTLEAEACGCELIWQYDDQPLPVAHKLQNSPGINMLDISDPEKRGRLPVVLEAMQRIKTALGQTVALIPVVTGPISLASQLLGKDIIKEIDHATRVRNPA